MNARILATVLTAVHDWKCPGHLYGTGALMVCAAKAIEHEKNGETWTPLGVCQEYANEKGYTQRNVWETMVYALKHSRGPLGPAVAIKAIVKGAYKNGCIDEV
jgi:hypothetical protein